MKESKNYITKKEMEKCKKVVSAFNELYEQADISVINTGKYGFVLLRYYDFDGFQNITTYTKSRDLFNALWQEWLKEKLFTLCCDTPLINLEYADMFKKLSKEKQNEILEIKRNLLYAVENENVKSDITSNSKSYITAKEKNRCRILADIFKKDLKEDDILIEETKKFGYILLQYYEPKKTFDSAVIFWNSQQMFDILLDEWFTHQITELMKKKHIDMDIDVFFDELPEEEKDELKKKKDVFIEKIRKEASFLKA